MELHWLAGLLEGEGSFLHGPPSKPNCPRITVQMTDLDVIQRCSTLMGVPYKNARNDKRNPKWKRAWALQLGNYRAVALMQRLHPLMGARRQAQIDRALVDYRPPKVDFRKFVPS